MCGFKQNKLTFKIQFENAFKNLFEKEKGFLFFSLSLTFSLRCPTSPCGPHSAATASLPP